MYDSNYYDGKIKTKEALKSITPNDAVDMLKKGNERFVKNNLIERDHHLHIKKTIDSQHPFALIHGCVDSRVDPAIIFDQGLGDLFITRIAGNIINNDIVGSMEYACAVVGSKLIVVLGHTSCGAVTGAVNGIELGNLTDSLKQIKEVMKSIKPPADETTELQQEEIIDKIAMLNVENAVNEIKKRSPILRKLVEEKKIMIVGAMYNHRTGDVRI